MGVVYKAFDSELERTVAEGRGNDGLFQWLFRVFSGFPSNLMA